MTYHPLAALVVALPAALLALGLTALGVWPWLALTAGAGLVVAVDVMRRRRG